MPVTLQSTTLKYKDGNGNYQDIDCLKGEGVPSGGTTGQVLKKKTNTDYDTEWANDSSGVSDVQVNGTSVLNAQGVANVPLASANGGYGLVKVGGPSNGVYIHNGSQQLSLAPADGDDIMRGNNSVKPITPAFQQRSTFYGLAKAAGDTTQSASSNAVGDYTEAAKSKISDMLSSPVTVTGTTPTITALSGIQYVCGEVSTLDITLPALGIVDVVFTSGSTPTVLTTTPPTGMTVEWANGFDSTALEADTLYELNIKMVGSKCLGVAVGWT